MGGVPGSYAPGLPFHPSVSHIIHPSKNQKNPL